MERYSAIAPYTDVTGDLEGLSNWTGQGVGLVNRIQPAADIVKKIAEEAVQVMRKANDLIGNSRVMGLSAGRFPALVFPISVLASMLSLRLSRSG